MTRDQMIVHLRAAGVVALEAAAHGHHPFAAVLVGPDDRILMRQGSINIVRHSQSEICSRAAAAYSPDFLWSCTMVSTFEPCPMCTGTLYWANIGRVVYGVEEAKLLPFRGDNPKDLPMTLSSRAILSSGQKSIQVHGPFPEIEAELTAPHRDFWVQRRST